MQLEITGLAEKTFEWFEDPDASGMEIPEIAKNAMGGTELMLHGLYDRVDKELLDQFQIIPTRISKLNKAKKRILWVHDLPGDPAVQHFQNKSWEVFDRIVFVSHWQYVQFLTAYNIPPSKCIVLKNAIEPVAKVDKPTDKIKIIYHTTPHRGLAILYPVFKNLAEKYDDIELDVYSSYKIYGWDNRDEQFQELFDQLEKHPKINYHKSVSNQEVKEAVAKSHIFAYPSIWAETSCISLMEAMSAGCVCVHPNFAALPETAANLTWMYHWVENPDHHATMFHQSLESAINLVRNKQHQGMVENSKNYADMIYGWESRKDEWSALLRGLLV